MKTQKSTIGILAPLILSLSYFSRLRQELSSPKRPSRNCRRKSTDSKVRVFSVFSFVFFFSSLLHEIMNYFLFKYCRSVLNCMETFKFKLYITSRYSDIDVHNTCIPFYRRTVPWEGEDQGYCRRFGCHICWIPVRLERSNLH